MQTLFSKLEDTYSNGVLIKKGKNVITDKDLETLKKSPVFNNYVRNGFVTILAKSEPIKEAQEAKEELDFDSMSYQEIKAYVTKNNIEVPSMKKDDILKVLKDKKES